MDLTVNRRDTGGTAGGDKSRACGRKERRWNGRDCGRFVGWSGGQQEGGSD